MKIRKIALKLSLAVLAALLLLTPIAISCSATELYTKGEGELKVVCTNFPTIDFASAAGGDLITLTALQTNGADLHSYTPTSKAIMALQAADVLVCVGGSSDDIWLDDALLSANNPNLRVIKLTECVDRLICTEDIHTTQPHEHEHDHEHEHEDGEHGHAHDEHVWTSLRNAQKIVTAISEAFAEIDTENAVNYRANAASYNQQLTALDALYSAEIANAEHNTLLFADRFPFIYLVEDYGLEYYAAFSGCSTEVNASFETTSTLISKVKEHNLSSIIIIDVSADNHPSIAQTVASSTGAQILSLNSCQAVNRKQLENGASYIDIMTENLNVLKEALN